MAGVEKKCCICKSTFIGRRNQFHCSIHCRKKSKNMKNQRNKNKNELSSREFINKIGYCEICGYNIKKGLTAHHYNDRDRLCVCGSCHRIWWSICMMGDHYSSKEECITRIQYELFGYNDIDINKLYNNNDDSSTHKLYKMSRPSVRETSRKPYNTTPPNVLVGQFD